MAQTGSPAHFNTHPRHWEHRWVCQSEGKCSPTGRRLKQLSPVPGQGTLLEGKHTAFLWNSFCSFQRSENKDAASAER